MLSWLKMQNNLKSQQDWLVDALQQQSRNDNKPHRQPQHAGFEYAIQPDGRSILEHIRESSSNLQFNFALPHQRASSSLQSIQAQATAAANRYQQREKPPIEAKPVAQRQISNAKIIGDNTSSLAISPSPRRRNRHNAVYGAFLPNSLNSPACAAKVFGLVAALNEERELCHKIVFPTSNDAPPSSMLYQTIQEHPQDQGDPDDEYDSLFAAIDVDQLVAQRAQQQQPATNTFYPQQYSHPSANSDYTVATSTLATTSSNANDGADDLMGTTSDSYRYFPKQHDQAQRNEHYRDYNISGEYRNSFSSAVYSENIPLCSGHNQPCLCLTANTSANQGRKFFKCAVMPESDKCDFFEWKDNNNSNSITTSFSSGTPQAMTGEIKDIYAENRRKFGHHSFREGQQEVIERAVRCQDVFVLMPTGGGKSLCYQLPAWCTPGLSVIFSPLLSLIQDQVQSMTKLGVESVFLNSQQDYDNETRHIMDRLYHTPAHGGIKLLYITPEKLSRSDAIKSLFKRLYSRGSISRFVIDEAHCLR